MRLKEIRLEREISQAELAAAMHTDVPMISKYENYKCLPIPTDMELLLKALACDLEDVYDESEIAFKRREKERGEPTEYKISCRLPREAKQKISSALKICNYRGVSDWLLACYRRLLAQEEILLKKLNN